MTDEGIKNVAAALTSELARMGHSLSEEQIQVLARAAISALDGYRGDKVDAMVKAAKERYLEPKTDPNGSDPNSP